MAFLIIQIPVGKEGRYVCSNRELGVERGGTEYFKVTCKNTSLTEAEVRKLHSKNILIVRGIKH